MNTESLETRVTLLEKRVDALEKCAQMDSGDMVDELITTAVREAHKSTHQTEKGR